MWPAVSYFKTSPDIDIPISSPPLNFPLIARAPWRGHRGRSPGGNRAPDGLRKQNRRCLAVITLQGSAFQPLARVSRAHRYRRSLPADKRRRFESTYTLELDLTISTQPRRLRKGLAHHHRELITSLQSIKGPLLRSSLRRRATRHNQHVLSSLDQQTGVVRVLVYRPSISSQSRAIRYR